MCTYLLPTPKRLTTPLEGGKLNAGKGHESRKGIQSSSCSTVPQFKGHRLRLRTIALSPLRTFIWHTQCSMSASGKLIGRKRHKCRLPGDHRDIGCNTLQCVVNETLFWRYHIRSFQTNATIKQIPFPYSLEMKV